MTKISIVIPNWNGEKRLLRHLPHVLQAAQHSNVEEVLIVDDASEDRSIEILEKDFPEVTLIKKNQNNGFSSTVNLGVKNSIGDIVVLLNNDASPKKDFLDVLIPHFKKKDVFSVGCNVGGFWTQAYFDKGYLWHQSASTEEGKGVLYHETLWTSGGSGAFRKDIWDEMGGLDTLFDPFYEEDMDLGYRAIKRGYMNLWESRSWVEHHNQGSLSKEIEKGVIASHFNSAFVQKTAQRNQLFFLWKNITSELLLQQHKQALVKMLITHPRYWSVFLAAVRHLPEVMQKRKLEQQFTKRTDEEILSLFRPAHLK